MIPLGSGAYGRRLTTTRLLVLLTIAGCGAARGAGDTTTNDAPAPEFVQDVAATPEVSPEDGTATANEVVPAPIECPASCPEGASIYGDTCVLPEPVDDRVGGLTCSSSLPACAEGQVCAPSAGLCLASDHPYLDWYATDDAACAWTRVALGPSASDLQGYYGGIVPSAREASVFFWAVRTNGEDTAAEKVLGIYRTDDRGASWQRLHTLDMSYRHLYADASGRHDFLMFSDAPELRWYWGTNGGATLEGLHGAGPLDGGWDFRVTTAKVASGTAIWVQSVSIDSLEPGQVLDRSLDDGATWERVPLGRDDDPARCVLAVSPAAPMRVYAACNSGVVYTRHRLYVSFDAASTWTIAEEWNDNLGINGLWVREDDADGLVLLRDAPYVSTDGGLTLKKIEVTAGFPEFRLGDLLANARPGFPYLLQDGENGFVAMDATGSTFRPFDAGLPAARGKCLRPSLGVVRSPLPPHVILAVGNATWSCWTEWPEAW